MSQTFRMVRPATLLLGLYAARRPTGNTRTGTIMPVGLHAAADKSLGDLLVATHTVGTEVVTVEPGAPFTDDQIAAAFSNWYLDNALPIPTEDGGVTIAYFGSVMPARDHGALPGVTDGPLRLVVDMHEC